MFHCTNAGHVPAYIPSSHVNDGICDPLCCDGTDEYDSDISCPNTCKALGQAARRRAEEDAKISLRGWKTRQTYVDRAAKKKAELVAEKERLQTQIVAAEQKQQSLKEVLDKAEILEGKVSRYGERIADRAREKMGEYKAALTALRDAMEHLNTRLDTLEKILEDLKNEHNQNYHDMAVKSAVKAWEELKAEEELENLENEVFDLGDDDVDFSDEFQDTVSLRTLPLFLELIGVYRIQDYFPEQVKEFMREKVAYARGILVENGLLADDKRPDGTTVSRALQKARDTHAQAVTETGRLRTQLDDIEGKLTFDHGPDDVFRAIKGDCVSLNTGEYTYEVCIMENVSQKSNKDSQTTSLGYPLSSPASLRL